MDPNEGFLKQLKEFEENGKEFGSLKQQQNKEAEHKKVHCLVMRRHSVVT